MMADPSKDLRDAVAASTRAHQVAMTSASECFLPTLALGVIGGRAGVVAFSLGRRWAARRMRYAALARP